MNLQTLLTLQTLRIILGVLGLVPIFIGLSGIYTGLDSLVPGAEITSVADGQYRYLSAIYFGFGCILIWIQFRLEQEEQLFRILMAIVFIAGLGRVAAMVAQGMPGFSVILATAFELVVPPILIFWHYKVVQKQ